MAVQPRNRGQVLGAQLIAAGAYYGRQQAFRVGGNAARYAARVGSRLFDNPSSSMSGKRSRGRMSSSSSSSRAFKKGTDRTGGYFGRYALAVGEKKFFDGTKSASVISTSGVISNDSLCEIPQGVTESTRVGRLAKIHSIHCTGYMGLPAAAGTAENDATDIIRIILYVDKQTNGATAAVLDILESADIESYRNLANSHRFYILMDKKVSLSAPGYAGATLGSARHLKGWQYNKHWKDPLPIEFNSTTGAIGEIRSNNIGMMIITEAGNGEVQYKWRVRFTD